MTEAEFLALDPRDRDATIAEKVMGWKRPTRELEPWDCSPMEHPGCVLKTSFQLPRFTSAFALAWQVVEKMMDNGLEFRTWSDLGWYAEFYPDGESTRGAAHNNDPELAWCIAALKAKGVIEC